MKKILFIILILQSNLTFSQSKKVQIEQFKVSVDSLKNVLENERNVNLKKVQELNAANVNFENQISLLKTEVKDATNNLNQKQLENDQLKNNLNLNLAEIIGLKSTLENERNSNLKKVQGLNVAIGNFENQISLLKSEIKDAVNNLNQKQLENVQLKSDLNLYLTEITTLKIQSLNKSDSLIIISNELKKIKTTTQSTNSNISENKKLIPQEIENDGIPVLEYIMNNRIIVLDSFSETDKEGDQFIRMKINNETIRLKMQKTNFTKFKRVFSNSKYIVTFFDILYGECTGEGTQAVTGKLRIESKTEFNIVNFKGSDAYFSSKKCQETGNG
jgi:predicted  nucleic acid-binding Zn-ribbon protein